MEPKEWLESIVELDTDRCLEPPFSISTVYWRGQPMSLAKVVCGEKNGWDVDLQLVAIRTCGTAGCANGAHYRWGSRSEAQVIKATKRDHAGSRNPNAKLSWEAAQDIRARVAAVPVPPVLDLLKGMKRRSTGITRAEVEVRRELAAKYGVSMRTIANVVEHRIWKGEE